MEDEMGGACSAHGRDEKYVQNFVQKNLKGGDYLEGLGRDDKIILERILGTLHDLTTQKTSTSICYCLYQIF
jgi:hypothetical protein